MSSPSLGENEKFVKGYVARLRSEASALEMRAAKKWQLAQEIEGDLNRRDANHGGPPRSSGEKIAEWAKTYTWPAEGPLTGPAVTKDEIEQWERDDEQNGYEQVSYAGSAPDPDDTLESKPQDVCPRGWTGGCKPSTCSRGCSASRVD